MSEKITYERILKEVQDFADLNGSGVLSIYYDETCFSFVYIMEVTNIKMYELQTFINKLESFIKKQCDSHNYNDIALTPYNLFIKVTM